LVFSWGHIDQGTGNFTIKVIPLSGWLSTSMESTYRYGPDPPNAADQDVFSCQSTLWDHHFSCFGVILRMLAKEKLNR